MIPVLSSRSYLHSVNTDGGLQRGLELITSLRIYHSFMRLFCSPHSIIMYVVCAEGFHSMSDLLQTATPIVEKLDPYSFHIAYKLFRDATRSDNGRPVKVSRAVVLKGFFIIGAPGSIISQPGPFQSDHA